MKRGTVVVVAFLFCFSILPVIAQEIGEAQETVGLMRGIGYGAIVLGLLFILFRKYITRRQFEYFGKLVRKGPEWFTKSTLLIGALILLFLLVLQLFVTNIFSDARSWILLVMGVLSVAFHKTIGNWEYKWYKFIVKHENAYHWVWFGAGIAIILIGVGLLLITYLLSINI